MIEVGWQPARGGMTRAAPGPKTAIMFVILGMTGIAISRGTLENMVDMTAFTGNIGMFTSQFESGQVVVKSGRQPACCRVTGRAVGAETAVVFIVRRVAGEAISGSTGKYIVDMTAFAGDIDMLAVQFESKQVMVNRCRQPACGRMTGRAVGAENAVVFIVRGVTGVAVSGSTNENMIDVTALTGHIRMFPIQFEHGQVVVKGGWFPTTSRVTGSAVRAVTSVMGIILRVTGVAVLWHRLEIRDGSRLNVAGGTGCFGVFAD